MPQFTFPTELPFLLYIIGQHVAILILTLLTIGLNFIKVTCEILKRSSLFYSTYEDRVCLPDS